MPFYTANCPFCSTQQTYFRKIADRTNTPLCHKCNMPTEKVMDAPRTLPDFAPYSCPITGKEIRGRREHAENLARHGCRVYEAGEFQDHQKFKEAQNEAFLDRMADAAAEQALRLPQEKFEILAGELANGAEAPFIRTTVDPVSP